MSSIKEILQKISEINCEIAEISSRSFSNSNPGPVLALRSLKRQKDRLHEKLENLRQAQQSVVAEDGISK